MASRTSKTNKSGASSSRIFGASKSIAASGISSAITGGGSAPAGVVIYEGRDVTPQSLLHRRIVVPNKKRGKVKNKMNSSVSTSKLSTSSVIDSKGKLESDSEDEGALEEETSRVENPQIGALAMQKKAALRRKQKEDGFVIGLSAKDGKENSTRVAYATFTLEETNTMMLLELPSECVLLDSVEHGKVSEKNAIYEKLCASKQGSDFFVAQQAQTINLAQKNKEVMAAPPATRDVECEATQWDIYDSQMQADESGGFDLEDNHSLDASRGQEGEGGFKLAKHVKELVDASMSTPGCLINEDEDIRQAIAHGITADSYGAPKGKVAQKHGGRDAGNASRNNASSVSRSTMNIRGNSNSVNLSRSKTNINGNSNSNIHGASNATAVSVASKDSDDVPERAKAVHVDISEVVAQRQIDKILSSTALEKSLATVERAVQQNNYHTRHLLYRNFPSAMNDEKIKQVDDENPASAPEPQEEVSAEVSNLSNLWEFKCSLTEGRTVTSMVWNTAIDDLLAVSYGSYNFEAQGEGLVLFWSLKNPEYPERIFKMKSGVNSIDFSVLHPNLLAVGFYNGIVAIYDTRKEDDIPILESGQSTNTHMDAVWQVKWVNKGIERGEALVSISSDGRVAEWNMKKGLSSTDLMVLKRVSHGTQDNKTDTTESGGIISRQASGTCIDFAKADGSVYFTGTEDGIIHKCSCSYNEQYLQSYVGHTAPVYRVHISPFLGSSFLSCSADWTVKLWDEHAKVELLSFHSVGVTEAIMDVCWSPVHSTIFASVSSNGRLEVWDLHQSTLDPAIVHFLQNKDDDTDQPNDICNTSIIFAPSAPVLAVGNSCGEVKVFCVPLLTKLDDLKLRKDEKIQQLKDAILSTNTNSTD